MREVKREQEHRDHVERGDDDVLEAVNHHRINVVPVERVGFQSRQAWIRDYEREVRDVIDDEREHHQTAQPHVTRCKRRFYVLRLGVLRRAGATVINRKADRDVDVDDDTREQEQANEPEERPEIPQMLGVAIDPIGPEENLQISDHVAEDKPEQNQPCDRDNDLFPDRGAVEGRELIHVRVWSAARAVVHETRSGMMSQAAASGGRCPACDGEMWAIVPLDAKHCYASGCSVEDRIKAPDATGDHACISIAMSGTEATSQDDLAVWDTSFLSFCKRSGLKPPFATAAGAAQSEAFAALFLIGLVRNSAWLRWRFPRALSGGPESVFAKWLQRRGPRRLGLTPGALRKIRGVLRKPPGRKVFDFYANIPELQTRFPFALLPFGRAGFLRYLLEQRGVSHQLSDAELLWFLHQTAADLPQSVALTYLLRPVWQQKHPKALSRSGWKPFTNWLKREYPENFAGERFGREPPAIQPVSAAGDTEERGVNILSHFCYTSGIQQAALFTRAALEAAGVTTSCRDVPAGVGTALPNRLPWLGLERFPATIITIPPTPHLASCYERSGLLRRAGVHRIGYWAWELERVPDHWLQLAHLVDEIWAPTEFVAEAMRRMALPVHRMLPGVELGRIEPVSRASIGVADDHYVFLFMFDMASQTHRKNPLGVVRAFRRAFERNERATLVIKVSRGDLMPADLEELRRVTAEHGVLLIDQTVSREAAYGMLQMCDCFVSLHRSEGFGLALAEAMLLGKPTIATRYSGNMDFMHPANSMLVDFELREIAEDRPIYTRGHRWAEPSLDHAAAYMRQVFEDREEATALGARAQAELREKLSLLAAGERMASRLREIENARLAD